ncbi:glycoside hydrolase family 16 protein [Lentzea tibetensis]|uniref:Glycoside hydrolase family 16 protein n=1 Tax=Lentzea tibetensis TaxID=2591470 RepID=A0A563ETR9_9PSEU|nr:glycoside hydrolase family 16 protein [Lentzea tibetensis]TWP50928.1 glycoside hydrolase family 16 protein [Lentzea tibetensis]
MTELIFEDRFDALGEHWFPHYLPHWSSRAATAARYEVGGGLRLRIDEGQPPWCPEFDDENKVSGFQTGVFSGPVGGAIGQSRFRPELRVREEQENVQLFTPTYGRFELRAKALDDPRFMVALWMIGYEDVPERSAEICIAEIFGKNVRDGSAGVGMGLHPFGDPGITDEFEVVDVPIDAREFHVYAAEWRPEGVRFFVDDQLVKESDQSPDYPMQFQLAIFEFPGESGATYPQVFEVDYFRAYR